MPGPEDGEVMLPARPSSCTETEGSGWQFRCIAAPRNQFVIYRPGTGARPFFRGSPITRRNPDGGLADRSGCLLFADHPAVFELDNAIAESGVALRVRDLNDGRAAFV